MDIVAVTQFICMDEPGKGGDFRRQLSAIGVGDLLDMRLAEYLVFEKGYRGDQILDLLTQNLSKGFSVKDVFMRSNILNDAEYLDIAASLHDMEPVILANEDIEIEMARHLLPAEQALDWQVLPYSRDDLGRLLVALSDPSPTVRDLLQQALSRETIVFKLCQESEIATWISRIYDPASSSELSQLVRGEEGEDGEKFVVREAALESRIIRIVNQIIDDAKENRASDIHIEPGESQTTIRFRVDGILRPVSSLQMADTQRVVARIKTMAQMRVDEKRVPQDGRATTKAGHDQAPLDLRVVTAPTIYGEQVSIRLLDPTQAMLSLEQLGMSQQNLDRYMGAISKPYGICLVAGPTGSGKSTTLYSSLQKIVTPKKKLISIEDPVEYRIPGITQIDVSGATAGLSFASALRSILRADPDIIMVGEIRDKETAQIAVDASLTGHFLYSTLHTNSALGSIVRLSRIGVDRFLVAEAVEIIVSQRLIRKLCSCKIEQPLDEATLQAIRAPAWAMSDSSKVLYRANPEGCAQCSGQGYLGRTGIHEVVQFEDELRQAIIKEQPLEELERVIRSQGVVSLRDDALQKVWMGVTSIEEMSRVTV